MQNSVTVVGAGLAGSECAWQLAERGVEVELVEQKPSKRTAAQNHDFFAELVCSNSFRGAALTNAVGLLKEEMRRAGSLIMQCGANAQVPAGGAFAVDREVFGKLVTRALHEHPRIQVVPREVTELPSGERPCIIATGPLTGDALAADLQRVIGEDHLAYYDAIAPVVTSESINWDVAFKASRYDKGDPDAYGNCPLNEEQYNAFVAAVIAAEKVEPRGFEQVRFFEGCLPVEVMAERGPKTLAFGPMKPVGLRNPKTGRRPFAVVQLRQENLNGSAYNLVGFQTRMKWPEQKRVLRMIPGLENAEFERFGSIHRNTFVNGPAVLDDEFQLKARANVFVAGQLTGVEGYIESAASGLVVGMRLSHRLAGRSLPAPPQTTALGALLSHVREPRDDFQPSNIVWSQFAPIDLKPPKGRKKVPKRERREAMAHRALQELENWLQNDRLATFNTSGGADSRATPSEGGASIETAV